VTAAIGFAMFMLPTQSSNYWSSFFPAMVVLGLGMAISVAPLTTTVMGSVREEQAGIASGINNAVSRAAGLLAIAIFGVVVSQTFSHKFARRLEGLALPNEIRTALYEQRTKLAGLELPANLDADTQRQLQQAVAESFVSGYRLIMLISACLGVAGAASAWLMIGKKKEH
jgi:hypothetical protein